MVIIKNKNCRHIPPTWLRYKIKFRTWPNRRHEADVHAHHLSFRVQSRYGEKIGLPLPESGLSMLYSKKINKVKGKPNSMSLLCVFPSRAFKNTPVSQVPAAISGEISRYPGCTSSFCSRQSDSSLSRNLPPGPCDKTDGLTRFTGHITSYPSQWFSVHRLYRTIFAPCTETVHFPRRILRS